MSKGELKPCPFCGGKAKMNNAVGEWWVTCVQCEEGNMSATEEAAAAIWNARTVPWMDARERQPSPLKMVLCRFTFDDGWISKLVGYWQPRVGWLIIMPQKMDQQISDLYGEPNRIQWMDIPE